MSKRTNIISNVISFAITMGLLLLAVILIGDKLQLGYVILFGIIGVFVSLFLHALFHELGHVIFGKKNGFKVNSVSVLFLKWTSVGKKTVFSFTKIGDEAGYTEMIPTSTDNLNVRYKKMTFGGLLVSFILMLISIAPYFLINVLPIKLVTSLMMFLPINAYGFFNNALPMYNGGLPNDGALCLSLRKQDDYSKVFCNLLTIQAETYNGKTPLEIDEKLYFDLPQLPEDNLLFSNLLVCRYNYYLDKEDYLNAKATSKRLLSLEDYLPKNYVSVIKADALYNACTFDFNGEIADDLMYESEKYLNKNNSLTNLRIKMAYLLYVREEKELLDIFIEKFDYEKNKCNISGLIKFEDKLVEKIKKDI